MPNLEAGWKEQQVYAFGEAVAPGARYTRHEPVSQATLESNVAVPFLQALGSGAFAGVALGTVAALLDWPRAATMGLATSALASGLVWAASLRTNNGLLWRVEEVIGADLNGDGNVGAPSPVRKRETEFEVKERSPINGRLVRLLKLRWPVPDDQVEMVANRLVQGKLALADWGRGTPLSVPKFKIVRESLIRAGYGQWKNPSHHDQGWTLTRSGYQFLAALPGE